MKKVMERLRGLSEVLSNKLKIHHSGPSSSSSAGLRGGKAGNGAVSEAADHLAKQLALMKQLVVMLRAAAAPSS